MDHIKILQPTTKDYTLYGEQIFSIFLAQSSYGSRSRPEQQQYFERWVDIYFRHWPAYFFIALREAEVLGYLCACPQSEEALKKINFHSFQSFSANYKSFPCHFHINVKPGLTGKGIGAKLIHALEKKLRQDKITSMHVITSRSEANYDFYIKNHFEEIDEAVVNNHPLVMLARKLDL